MKRTRKILAVVLAVVTALSVVQLGTMISFADTSFDEGDFRFTVTSGDKLLVSKYYGSSTDVTLPGTVNDRQVTGIYRNCFRNVSPRCWPRTHHASISTRNTSRLYMTIIRSRIASLSKGLSRN